MQARAIQRTVRQSARKMRLVIDLIRGRLVPEADAILRFSKKLAARQIRKVLKSAVANAEQLALKGDRRLDVDRLRVTTAVINEGPTLKRYTSAALGRATPILKRTSHVEIHVAEDPEAAKVKAEPATPRRAKAAAAAKSETKPTAKRQRSPRGKKPAKRKGRK
jgi:large subunit ribosomal protein L22